MKSEGGDAATGISMDTAQELYLDLMMRSLTDWLYDEFAEPVRAEPRPGRARAHTMIGLKRLANVRSCIESVLADGIPGDLIETGKAWRGGTTENFMLKLFSRFTASRIALMYESTIQAFEPALCRPVGLSVGGFVIVDDYGNVAGCRQAVHDYRAGRGITDPIQPIDWAGVYWRRSLEGGGACTMAERRRSRPLFRDRDPKIARRSGRWHSQLEPAIFTTFVPSSRARNANFVQPSWQGNTSSTCYRTKDKDEGHARDAPDDAIFG